jgi:transcriptional regulator
MRPEGPIAMYVPEFFHESRREELQRVMTEHPLGTLVTQGRSGLTADHLPFVLDPAAGEHGGLRAHVARANPVWRDVRDGDEVLVIFHGGDAYVTPSFYPSKHDDPRQVPTWNYRVVHAHGRITVVDDAAFVRSVVARLTHGQEAGRPAPWKMSDAPPDYLDAALQAIVGLQVEITRLVGKFKLSQNRELRDRRGAGEGLKGQGEHELGQAVLDAIPSSAPDAPRNGSGT